MNLIETAFEKAIEALRKSVTEFGFKASERHYEQIWARDACISSLGATVSGDPELVACSRRTLITLSNLQTALGQVPNTFHLKSKHLTLYATDATLWWLITAADFYNRTGDQEFLHQIWPSVKRAVTWLQYQVIDTTGLINSPAAGDWMDSTIQRWGKVFYNNVLFYKAVVCANDLAHSMDDTTSFAPDDLEDSVNAVFWPSEPVRRELLTGWHMEYYTDAIDPFRDHYLEYVSHEYSGPRCDVIANCLAILWGLADKEKQDRILSYMASRHLSEPYPIRVIDPPLLGPDASWYPRTDLRQPSQSQNAPYCFHNAGIWPWVGGFYVATLVNASRDEEAHQELEKLAHANKAGKKEWEFNEWLHGKTGEPMGAVSQAWSASGYITAYRAVLDGVLPALSKLGSAKIR